ncbi:hypothetical protein IHE44_0011062 [Lamprotornis superbus]|uniref:Uncharacterized protein n=1 Tax=Lamprotornis superbus TaxID=245042 RepID=A0A835NDI8_9PASS|nr:hypothetical protein IHE44_0011062 [Lamprotornis superbus]
MREPPIFRGQQVEAAGSNPKNGKCKSQKAKQSISTRTGPSTRTGLRPPCFYGVLDAITFPYRESIKLIVNLIPPSWPLGQFLREANVALEL